MKLFIDFLPIILFFIAYKIHGIYFATEVLIVASILLMLWQRWRQGRVESMTWISTLLVLLFGGLTIYFHNDTFIKWKPSILYLLFAGALLWTHWRETPLLQRVMGGQLPVALPNSFWRRLNRYWIGFFLFLAALNILVAYSFPTAIWVDFKLFGMLILTVLFVIYQAILIGRALPAEANGSGDSA